MVYTCEFTRFCSTAVTMSDVCKNWVDNDFTPEAIDAYHVHYEFLRELQIMQYFESSDTSTKHLQPAEFAYNSGIKANWVYNQTEHILDSGAPIVSVVALGIDKETKCVTPKAIDLFGVKEVFERLALKTVQNKYAGKILSEFYDLIAASYDVEFHKIRLLIRYLKGVTEDQYTDEYKILIQKKIKSNKKYRKLIKQYNDQLARFERIEKSDAEREYDKFINMIQKLCDVKSKTMGELLKDRSKYQIRIGAKLLEIMKTVIAIENCGMQYTLDRIKTICDITPGETLGITSYRMDTNHDTCKFGKFVVSFPFASLICSFFSYYYRFPEYLQKLCIRHWELVVQHEFGHVLSFMDMEQKKKPTIEAEALFESDDDACREYDKFCEEAKENPEISVADINRKYRELPLEKLADEYGCVNPEEVDQIDKALESYEESIMNKNDKFTWVF